MPVNQSRKAYTMPFLGIIDVCDSHMGTKVEYMISRVIKVTDIVSRAIKVIEIVSRAINYIGRIASLVIRVIGLVSRVIKVICIWHHARSRSPTSITCDEDN